jgi:2-dehydro-3-deoxy-D-arabinonate dehydratase
MLIVRFADDSGTIHIGRSDEDGIRKVPARRMADLLRLPLEELRERVDAASGQHMGPVRLLPPIDGLTEVWASGVTYERSRKARMEESSEQSVYDRVYTAERPELFFKALPWRVVTDGEPIGIREDSPLNVPEPELSVVANSDGEIVGYGVCNDVSSRSIEGDNPLYLPQAKVYAGSCALAPGIRPVWEVPDARQLDVTLEVRRADRIAYEGRVCTSALHRDPDELVDYLLRGQPFPEGVVLATGTGVVPDLDFSLQDGDVVRITVADVGELTNPVAADLSTFNWLVDSIGQR